MRKNYNLGADDLLPVKKHNGFGFTFILMSSFQSVVMHRLSKNDHLLDMSRPEIHLRNHNKVKFKTHNRIHEKYLKSPISRGVTMWDRIPESVQRSTTKVKFKRDLKPYLIDLLRPVPR